MIWKNITVGAQRRRDILVCLFLVITTLIVYSQVKNYEFVDYDDDRYVTDNVRVKNGLSLDNIIWAFKSTTVSNWHPITWLSHMLDVELYGLNPGAHHQTNVIFHLLNTLLLFFIFWKMTGGLWQSGFVAALFALHPLHVESVAWVSERKDVLSTFFWMLTMWSYARYAAHPGIGRYLPVVGFFILGLMAKPMLITLPFVLLLLDYWPLRRIQFNPAGDGIRFTKKQSSGLFLIWEKIPLLFLALASSVVTYKVQKMGGAVGSMEIYPFTARVANALVSYVKYLGKMIWPAKLAAFYPHPSVLPVWQVVGAGVLLGLVTFVAIRSFRQRPWFIVGWLWFLGTLVPVIGLVQVGLQAMADRYTYIPLIGVFIIFAWGVPGLLPKWRHKEKLLGLTAIVVFIALSITSWMQIQYWKNSHALFKHALDVTEYNYLAHNAFGNALKEEGKSNEAIHHYLSALEIRPDYAAPHYNMGHTLVTQGKYQDAIDHFQKAIQIKPNYAAAHDNLGYLLMRQGKTAEAIVHYLEAVRIKPDDAAVHNRLGLAMGSQGQFDNAITQFYTAVKINPFFAEAHNNLGHVLMKRGRLNEAINHFEAALRIKPDFEDAQKNLKKALAALGGGDAGLKKMKN